jgi:hypothetical protein
MSFLNPFSRPSIWDDETKAKPKDIEWLGIMGTVKYMPPHIHIWGRKTLQVSETLCLLFCIIETLENAQSPTAKSAYVWYWTTVVRTLENSNSNPL